MVKNGNLISLNIYFKQFIIYNLTHRTRIITETDATIRWRAYFTIKGSEIMTRHPFNDFAVHPYRNLIVPAKSMVERSFPTDLVAILLTTPRA